jgi:hypothetical protein
VPSYINEAMGGPKIRPCLIIVQVGSQDGPAGNKATANVGSRQLQVLSSRSDSTRLVASSLHAIIAVQDKVLNVMFVFICMPAGTGLSPGIGSVTYEGWSATACAS